MDKSILTEYIDARELVKETQEEIEKLERKQKTVAQTTVSGSNPEHPYQRKHFKGMGTTFTPGDSDRLRKEKEILEERKENAERTKLETEQWLNTIPVRMQRIIRYKIFEGLTWEQTARKMGRNATGDSVRMEFKKFMENKK